MSNAWQGCVGSHFPWQPGAGPVGLAAYGG